MNDQYRNSAQQSLPKECVCPNCGGELREIKQKFICPRCGIIEGCCEGGKQ